MQPALPSAPKDRVLGTVRQIFLFAEEVGHWPWCCSAFAFLQQSPVTRARSGAAERIGVNDDHEPARGFASQ